MKKTKKKVKGPDISNYTPPDNVVKIPDGDTGFNLVKKNYHRFIWTWNEYGNKQMKK
jgi:hypothetical protein